MLKELLENLQRAYEVGDIQEKLKAYEELRKVGMDMATAHYLLIHREEWE